MYYVAFSIQNLKKGTAPKVITAICHAFAGCGCGDKCDCKRGKSCDDCHFSNRKGAFAWSVCELKTGVVFAVITRDVMMQVDVYTAEQFDFHGLRVLAEALRMFSDNRHLTMTHMLRDRLTEETTD
ncbi:hypothetical protein LCGC14_2356680 [marine sediment metagenome]|uniref:Uncharacterized protein n=1 Tax=marine sediment metagenome TaxID=412755 RepID=A0A0F9C7J1_9ZZZZ